MSKSFIDFLVGLKEVKAKFNIRIYDKTGNITKWYTTDNFSDEDVAICSKCDFEDYRVITLGDRILVLKEKE